MFNVFVNFAPDMKQILLINDVVGYGKVGMGAMLPILSYLGIPTYSLPTALVSNTLDYGKFNIQDTTDYIRGTLPVWKELGFSFDAVCTGLMFSDEQAKLVAGYCKEQGAQGTTVFVDPILGDGGRLYNGMTERQVELMRSPSTTTPRPAISRAPPSTWRASPGRKRATCSTNCAR